MYQYSFLHSRSFLRFAKQLLPRYSSEKAIPEIIPVEKSDFQLNQYDQETTQKSQWKYPSVVEYNSTISSHNPRKLMASPIIEGLTPKEVLDNYVPSRKAVHLKNSLKKMDLNFPTDQPKPFVSKMSSFQEMRQLNPVFVKAIKDLYGIESPTEIQEKAIPCILNHETCVMIAETGSGKTLAYVLPLLDSIMKYKDTFLDTLNAISKRQNPRYAIILLPTWELLEQVFSVVNDLITYLKLDIQILKTGPSLTKKQRGLPLESDVKKKVAIELMTMDYLLMESKHDRKKKLQLSRMVIVDETDHTIGPNIQLLGSVRTVGGTRDRIFQDLMEGIVPMYKSEEQYSGIQMAKPNQKEAYLDESLLYESSHDNYRLKQLVFCGATLPANVHSVRSYLCRKFQTWNYTWIETAKSHSKLENLDSHWIPLTSADERPDLVCKIIFDVELDHTKQSIVTNDNDEVAQSDVNTTKEPVKVIIFCYSRLESAELALHIQENIPNHFSDDEIDVIELNAKLNDEIRMKNLDQFRHPTANKKLTVLLTTHILSRGVDVPNVNLVINYNTPDNFIDYLHQSGRTGRMGQSGRVITFVQPGLQAKRAEKYKSEAGKISFENLKSININKFNKKLVKFARKKKTDPHILRLRMDKNKENLQQKYKEGMDDYDYDEDEDERKEKDKTNFL